MAFITNSVGLGAKNFPQDVKIIQWMLIRAQTFYGTFRLFSREYALAENGFTDAETNAAVRDIVLVYPNKSLTKHINSSSIIYDATPTKPIIFPDDSNYRFLLRCSLKPICVVCTEEGERKIDFSDDPLAIQAIAGRINFQTFKHLAENKDGSLCETLTKEGIEAKALLKDPRIRAFLEVIKYAEGYFANRVVQYHEGSDWVTLPNFDDHPGRTLPGAGSSAAGAYQIMTDTWFGVKAKNDPGAKKILGLTDFTPESQDIFAVYKMKTQGIITPLFAGKFADAIQAGCGEWASFPDNTKGDATKNPKSHYSGQHAAPLNKLEEVYNKALGK
jgi:muramidase (phage lysozyme)